jgi:hypothetical protein
MRLMLLRSRLPSISKRGEVSENLVYKNIGKFFDI